MRAKAEVESASGEEMRKAGLTNEKAHRGKVRQVKLYLSMLDESAMSQLNRFTDPTKEVED